MLHLLQLALLLARDFLLFFSIQKIKSSENSNEFPDEQQIYFPTHLFGRPETKLNVYVRKNAWKKWYIDILT